MRKLEFTVEEFYHIYNRGVDKRIIFTCDEDRQRFTSLLYICNGHKAFEYRFLKPEDVFSFDRGETLVDIGVYTLMSNHFHLLLKEKTENGIAKFMHRLLVSYSMYFNKKYHRTGSLFESTFKATHVDRDEYLRYLFAYIHLNPIKLVDSKWKENGVKDRVAVEKFLKDYKWSSYFDYLGVERPERATLNRSAFPEYFSEEKDFASFINDWLSFDGGETSA